jgi:gluconate 2-dehydrogenase gamma chain
MRSPPNCARPSTRDAKRQRIGEDFSGAVFNSLAIGRTDMSDRFSRKDFVAIVGTATAAAAVSTAPAPSVAAAETPPVTPPAHHHAATQTHTQPHGTPAAPALGLEPEAYVFFTGPESAFVEAAVERLIPADANGPGAKDAGVAYFIDQQLNGVFGVAGNSYRSGPWLRGTPMQGYQLRQTPAELYRQGIAAVNDHCATTYRKTFDALDAAHQDAVLQGLDTGTIAFDAPPSKAFFELLLQNTIEGFFADPLYGGNRDKAGWKLVGFPGVAAYYAKKISDWNVPYHVEPVSIADVQQGKPVVSANPELLEHMAMMGEMKMGNAKKGGR